MWLVIIPPLFNELKIISQVEKRVNKYFLSKPYDTYEIKT